MTDQVKMWVPVAIYAPEFVDTELDIPDQMQDIMLAHKIANSGRPNKYGCRIPLHTHINLALFDCFLLDYED